MSNDDVLKNFWTGLPKPFLALAPLADVTDPAFRRIIAKYGKPSVLYTEFVSADGLFLGGKGVIERDLVFDESERPIVAQFFTSRPDMMKRAADHARHLGFDGVDINMGCPDKSVERQGAGAALINNPSLASELVAAAREGAGEITVSVKTRLGYNKSDVESWIVGLLEIGLDALAVHSRTRKEMSKVPAHWEEIKRIVALRDRISPSTLIIGNGDIADTEDGMRKAREYGCDGVMIGRAIFGKPWLFNPEMTNVSIKKRIEILVEHTRLFEELLPHKKFSIMKKHFRAYVSGWDGARELRLKLMDAIDADEVEKIVKSYI
jgi:nifR3 family TIM-barrel protein